MNERIKALAEQAGLWPAVTDVFPKELEHFAELVLQNYASQLITDAEQARKDEREACARLCDKYQAETIRARGRK
jgi:hypothetical protein